MKRTITEERCAQMGFNDLFAEEVERVLSVFRRVSPSLRNAAIFCVASRHSLYVGYDEVPTRAVDLRRIQLSPYLDSQQAPDPQKYVRRLAARLGRSDLLNECDLILRDLVWTAPFLNMRDMATASLVIADEALDLPLLAHYVKMSETHIARVVALALDVPKAHTHAVLTPTPPIPLPQAPARAHVQPTVFEPATCP